MKLEIGRRIQALIHNPLLICIVVVMMLALPFHAVLAKTNITFLEYINDPDHETIGTHYHTTVEDYSYQDGDPELILERKAHFNRVGASSAGALGDIHWHPSGAYAIIIGDDGLYAYTPTSNTTAQVIRTTKEINAFAWAPSGLYGVAVGNNNYVYEYTPGSVTLNPVYPPEKVDFDISEDLLGIDFFAGLDRAIIVGESGLVMLYEHNAENKIQIVQSSNAYCAVDIVIEIVYEIIRQWTDIGSEDNALYDRASPYPINPASANEIFLHGFEAGPKSEDWTRILLSTIASLIVVIVSIANLLVNFAFTLASIALTLVGVITTPVLIGIPIIYIGLFLLDMFWGNVEWSWDTIVNTTTEYFNENWYPDYPLKDGFDDYPDFNDVVCVDSDTAYIVGQQSILKYEYGGQVADDKFHIFDEITDFKESVEIKKRDFQSPNGLLTALDWPTYKSRKPDFFAGTYTKVSKLNDDEILILGQSKEESNRTVYKVYDWRAESYTKTVGVIDLPSISGLDVYLGNNDRYGYTCAVSDETSARYLRGQVTYPNFGVPDNIPTGSVFGDIAFSQDGTFALYTVNKGGQGYLYKYTDEEFWPLGHYEFIEYGDEIEGNTAWVSEVTLAYNGSLEDNTDIVPYISWNANLAEGERTWYSGVTKDLFTQYGSDLFKQSFYYPGFKFELSGDEYHTPFIYDVEFSPEYSLPPKASLRLSPPDGGTYTTNDVITFTVDVGASSYQYTNQVVYWNFGDDQDGSNVSYVNTIYAEYQYDRPGKYLVSWLYNCEGGNVTDSEWITISNTAPTVQVYEKNYVDDGDYFSLLPTESICFVHANSYDESRYGNHPVGMSWKYDWGDGTFNIYRNYTDEASHHWDLAGNYTVTITLTDAGSIGISGTALSSVKTMKIEVDPQNPKPIAVLTGDGNSVLQTIIKDRYTYMVQYGTMITFDGTNSYDRQGDTIIDWEFQLLNSAGIIVASQNGSSTMKWLPSITDVGKYTIKLRVQDNHATYPEWSFWAEGICWVRYCPNAGLWVIDEDLAISDYNFEVQGITVTSGAQVNFINSMIHITSGQLECESSSYLELRGSHVMFHPGQSGYMTLALDATSELDVVSSIIDSPSVEYTDVATNTVKRRHYYWDSILAGKLTIQDSALAWMGQNSRNEFGLNLIGNGMKTIADSFIGYGQTVAITAEGTGDVVITGSTIAYQGRLDHTQYDIDADGVEDTVGIKIASDGIVTISGCDGTSSINPPGGLYDHPGGLYHSSFNVYILSGTANILGSNISFAYKEGIRQEGGFLTLNNNYLSQNGVNALNLRGTSSGLYADNRMFGKGKFSYGIVSDVDCILRNNTLIYFDYPIRSTGGEVVSIGSSISKSNNDPTAASGGKVWMKNYLNVQLTAYGAGLDGITIYGWEDRTLRTNSVTDINGKVEGILLTDYLYEPGSKHEYLNKVTFLYKGISRNSTIEMSLVDQWIKLDLTPPEDTNGGGGGGGDDDGSGSGTSFDVMGIDSWWEVGGLIVIILLGAAMVMYFNESGNRKLQFVAIIGTILGVLAMLAHANGWSTWVIAGIYSGIGVLVYYMMAAMDILPMPSRAWLSKLAFWRG